MPPILCAGRVGVQFPSTSLRQVGERPRKPCVTVSRSEPPRSNAASNEQCRRPRRSSEVRSDLSQATLTPVVRNTYDQQAGLGGCVKKTVPAGWDERGLTRHANELLYRQGGGCQQPACVAFSDLGVTHHTEQPQAAAAGTGDPGA